MKLIEIILLSLAVAFFIIGIHQTFTVGILESYWIFMLTVGLILLYKLKKNNSSLNPASTDKHQSAISRTPNKNKKRKIHK